MIELSLNFSVNSPDFDINLELLFVRSPTPVHCACMVMVSSPINSPVLELKIDRLICTGDRVAVVSLLFISKTSSCVNIEPDLNVVGVFINTKTSVPPLVSSACKSVKVVPSGVSSDQLGTGATTFCRYIVFDSRAAALMVTESKTIRANTSVYIFLIFFLLINVYMCGMKSLLSISHSVNNNAFGILTCPHI